MLRPIAALTALLAAAPAFAQERPVEDGTEPLWEVGAAVGVGVTPDYPGADQSGFRWIGLPYVVYRGEFLRLGEEGGGAARGVFVDNDRYEFDISLRGAFPTDSDDNDAREGMPDIDWIGEIGPNVRVKLGQYGPGEMRVHLPLRAVFSTDFSSTADYRGVVFNPTLVYDVEDLGGRDLDMTFTLGPVFATERLHDYFYEVDPRYATSSRSEYDADGGYMGSRMGFGVGYQLTEKLRLFGGASLDYYGGAANSDSPLLKSDLNASVGAGVIWTFWESDRRVPWDD